MADWAEMSPHVNFVLARRNRHSSLFLVQGSSGRDLEFTEQIQNRHADARNHFRFHKIFSMRLNAFFSGGKFSHFPLLFSRSVCIGLYRIMASTSWKALKTIAKIVTISRMARSNRLPSSSWLGLTWSRLRRARSWKRPERSDRKEGWSWRKEKQ